MNKEILKFSLEKGLLLDKDTLELLSELDDETARDFVKKISSLKEKIITKSFFSKNAEKISELIGNEKVIDKLKINMGLSLEISRERIIKKEPEENKEVKFKLDHLKVLFSLPNVTKKIEAVDFIKYFRIRYQAIKSFLQDRKELENLTSINKINGKRQGVSIIGIVFEKRISKNKNIMLEVEDLTGKTKVLVNKNKSEVYEKAKGILVDDIIGIKGFGNEEIIFANEIIWPDVFLSEKARLDRDERVVFISDIHVGSNNFLEEKFIKFIRWVNGEVGDEKQKEEALKVKYLLITGDCVDGIGIFPGQEDGLNIKNIKEQYNKLAFYLSSIRKDVMIVMCPGQHDSVWLGQPQPPIGKDYASSLYELENVVLVSNPAIIEISEDNKRGVRILMFHGASLISYINEIEALRLGKTPDNPSRAVKELLKRRHLASVHSIMDYVPNENSDYLVIKEIPDIIATADLHRADVDLYNNVLIICSSCWQSMTAFEEKVGNHPDPCKVPVFNLKTREIKIMDFSDEEKEDKVEKECREEEDKVVCEVK